MSVFCFKDTVGPITSLSLGFLVCPYRRSLVPRLLPYVYHCITCTSVFSLSY